MVWRWLVSLCQLTQHYWNIYKPTDTMEYRVLVQLGAAMLSTRPRAIASNGQVHYPAPAPSTLSGTSSSVASPQNILEVRRGTLPKKSQHK